MKLFYTFFSLLFLSSIMAQDCEPITASDELVHGNLQFNILNGSNAFNELNYKIGIGPNAEIGTREYAPIIYSNNIWAGAIDQNGEIRLAAGKYIDQDWVAGPLDSNGETTEENCQNWNKVFTVTKEEILLARKIYLEDGPCEDIPESVRKWPARGNYTLDFSINHIAADFFDNDGNIDYNACNGDLPAVSIRNGEHHNWEEYFSSLPKQISYYLMNDKGSPHFYSNGNPIALEVAVYVFTYETSKAEDVIFVKYKIRNSSLEVLENFHFGSWFDFDLGCKTNDYIGTDLDRNMIYAYNHSDETNCTANEKQLPSSQIGVSYLGGIYEPYLIFEDENGNDSLVITDSDWEVDTLVRTKMKTSIIPINCQNVSEPNTCNPQSPSHFYNILKGKNKNGSPIIDNTGMETSIMYSDEPDDNSGWSLCTDPQVPETSAIMTTGTPILQPYASNEILIALCYAEDTEDGCINPRAVQYKQEQAQELYDEKFFHLMGPPPPKMVISHFSNAITLEVENIPFEYSEQLPEAQGFDDDKYNFEGIKIYQVNSPNFDMTELNNSNYSYLVYQGDVENAISDIKNWEAEFNSGTQTYIPIQKVDGSNIGVQGSLIIEYDYLNDMPIDPAKSYYFIALSYAYNNYNDFNPANETGQQNPYLEGRCGVKVLSSDDLLSNEELIKEKSYIFQSNSHNWTLQNDSDNLKVSLLASNGQRIKIWSLTPNSTIRSNDVSNLSSGVYFLQIFSASDKRFYVHKIVKIE